MINPPMLSDDTSIATKPKVLCPKIMHQVAAMRGNVSHMLARKHAKYKRYFAQNVPTLPTFTIGQQPYVDSHPLTSMKDDDKAP